MKTKKIGKLTYYVEDDGELCVLVGGLNPNKIRRTDGPCLVNELGEEYDLGDGRVLEIEANGQVYIMDENNMTTVINEAEAEVGGE